MSRVYQAYQAKNRPSNATMPIKPEWVSMPEAAAFEVVEGLADEAAVPVDSLLESVAALVVATTFDTLQSYKQTKREERGKQHT